MKRIAFISSGYLPLPSVKGGAVETLIDMLTDSDKINSKYKLDVYSLYDKEAINESKKRKNTNYYYIKNENKLKRTIRYIINHIGNLYIGNDFISFIIRKYKDKLKKYDYVIVENKPEFGLLLRKQVKGKLIFHSHNDFLNKNTKRALKIYNSYDQIFCLSKYICNRVKEINLNDNSNKVKLLYNGIDIDKFSNVSPSTVSEMRKKYSIGEDDKVFMYSGRIVKEKGVKELILAFNKIHDEKAKLLVTGSVGYGKTTKDKYSEEIYNSSKNNKNIIFTGYIDYKEMPSIYNMADYGIVPSIWEEPFALTLIEHLASGHPVIITKSGAMPELVNNSCALIVDKDEIVNNLKEDLVNIQNIDFKSNNCIKAALKFSKDKYIDTFLELLEEEK